MQVPVVLVEREQSFTVSMSLLYFVQGSQLQNEKLAPHHLHRLHQVSFSSLLCSYKPHARFMIRRRGIYISRINRFGKITHRSVKLIPPCCLSSLSCGVIKEQLTEADLSTLMNDLTPVAHKWNFICLQLGVPQSTLVNIEAQPMRIAGAPLTFLQDGLFEWLRVGSDSCTITLLCEALTAPSVDEAVLAAKVEESLKRKKGNWCSLHFTIYFIIIINFYRSSVISTYCCINFFCLTHEDSYNVEVRWDF